MYVLCVNKNNNVTDISTWSSNSVADFQVWLTGDKNKFMTFNDN